MTEVITTIYYFQCNSLSRSQSGEEFATSSRQFDKIERLQVQLQRSCVGAGQHQQFVDQSNQPVGFPLHGCEQRAAPFVIVERAIFEGFDGAFDDGQRGAQFVRDIGDEGLLGLVGLAQAFRHVVEGLAETVKFADITFRLHALFQIPVGDGSRRVGKSLQRTRDLRASRVPANVASKIAIMIAPINCRMIFVGNPAAGRGVAM